MTSHSCCGAIPARPGAPSDAASTPAFASGAKTLDIVRLPGGVFRMGSDARILPADGEGPARRMRVDPFGMQRCATTNRDFVAFVASTDYRTDAERFGWSFVFANFLSKNHPAMEGAAGALWWRKIEGAQWRNPEGPDSTIDDRQDHPVTHVSWNDAAAYAAWAGGRLPAEAEWEYAAQGGRDGATFPWGEAEPSDDANLFCNIWQGRFPDRDSGADGFSGTAPVDSFAPNGFGLFNMVGNVWEWCADRHRIKSLKRDAKARNQSSVISESRVMKGGSYLCHRSYCYRYRIAARIGNPPDTSTGHLGFRIVVD